MKIASTLGLLLAGCFSLFGQEVPDWVKERPVSSLYYIGIGRALKTDQDYMKTAKQNALKDLASELKVQVSSTSLLHTIEGEGGEVDSRLEETVRVSACEEVENFHLAGTWQDDKEYWVYYELSIIDYEEYLAKRKNDAIAKGYDFWIKGNEAVQAGGLMAALEFWFQGLQEVQSVINEELRHEHNGSQVDVACELYGSVKNVFGGMTLGVGNETVSVAAYRPAERPVELTLSKGKVPMKNVPLEAVFIQGDGRLGGDIRTDAEGKAKLRIENVTSSLPRQQVKVKVGGEAFRALSGGIFGKLMENALLSAPQAIVELNLTGESLKACIVAENGADASVVRAVKEVLSRNRFVVVSKVAVADVKIAVSASTRKGEKQRAGVSSVVAWYATVNVTVAKGETVLLEYCPEEVKVLQSESVSDATAKRAVVNELTKRMNRQLPELLKSMYQ